MKSISLISFLSVFTVTCLCCVSCASGEKSFETSQQDSIPVFDQSKHQGGEKPNTTDFTELFYAIRIIPLQTTSESLIGEINVLKQTEDRIIIITGRGKRALLFDKDGIFINQLGKMGRGPGEYVRANDVDFDVDSKSIFLLDNTQGKIIVYDPNAAFKEEINLGEIKAKSFAYAGDQKFWIELRSKQNRGPLLALLNYDGVIEEVFLEDMAIRDYPNIKNSGIRRFGETIRLANQNINIIYNLEEGSIEPFIKIVPDPPYDLDALEEYEKDDFNPFDKDYTKEPEYKGFKRLHDYFETDKYVLFNYQINWASFTPVIYHKESNEFKRSMMFDDLFTNSLTSSFVGSGEDYFLYPLGPNSDNLQKIKDLSKNSSIQFLNTEAELSRIDQLGDDSNQILVVLYHNK